MTRLIDCSEECHPALCERRNAVAGGGGQNNVGHPWK
jgi:hypothetical protein